MIQPEAIREIRKKYGLTQGELAGLLGWGVATLSRYENGALQSSAHDRLLALATEPRNLLKLVDATPDALTEEKRQHLKQLLAATISRELSFKRIYEDRFGAYEPDAFSGYKRLDLSKLFNAILYFCRGQHIPTTKVNKLLFYADFKHFKEYTVAITGARYARMPFGPAPDNYSYYFATLQEENAIEVEEIIFDQGAGEYFRSLRDPDLSIFTDGELKILAVVKENLKDFTARAISDMSHQEKGYIDTPMGHPISYEYADELKI